MSTLEPTAKDDERFSTETELGSSETAAQFSSAIQELLSTVDLDAATRR